MYTNLYHFDHDYIGNRTYAEFPDHEEEYEVNGQNAYTAMWSYNPSYTHDKFAYDLDGNMLTNQIKYSSDVWVYSWNAENRMTSATNTANGTYVTYKYDYQGRMFEKVTNGDKTRFIWNGNHIISEMTDSSTNLYCWVNGETLTASLDGSTVFYCHDANKNVTDLVDTSGDSGAHYEYSPFGVRTTTDEQPSAETNPFGFSNEYFDSTTGFVEFWQRKYIPPLGKFASQDPIGIQGGLNESAICGNDLINKFDLWGLSEDEVLVVVFLDMSLGNFRLKHSQRLFDSISSKLIWNIKLAAISADYSTGEQESRKYDDECWKKVYFVETRVVNSELVVGYGQNFDAIISMSKMKNAYVKYNTFGLGEYSPDDFYYNGGEFTFVHEVLHSVGAKHIGKDSQFIMHGNKYNVGWLDYAPIVSIQTARRVSSHLGVNK